MILEIQAIDTFYGLGHILHGLSLGVGEGEVVALMRGLKGRYTIVLIEHKMDIIMSVSDRVSVMHFGSLIAEGTPAEIQKNAEVRRAYLGGVAA